MNEASVDISSVDVNNHPHTFRVVTTESTLTLAGTFSNIMCGLQNRAHNIYDTVVAIFRHALFFIFIQRLMLLNATVGVVPFKLRFLRYVLGYVRVLKNTSDSVLFDMEVFSL